MGLTREAVLQEMERAWQEFRHQLRDLDYSLDWKGDFQDPEAWSARDVVSHVLGMPEQSVPVYLRHILSGEGTEMAMESDNPVRTPERRAAALTQLQEMLKGQYQEVRQMVLDAAPQQLEATGRFLGMAEGAEWTFLDVSDGFSRHLCEHTDQLLALREELGVVDL